MSVLPSTTQTPAADPPPQNTSLEDIMGGGAAALAASQAAASPAGSAAPATNQPIDQNLQKLSNFFGLAGDATKDNASASAALKPMIEMIAKGGMQQAQAQAQAPAPAPAQAPAQAPVQPPAGPQGANVYGQVTPVEIKFDDIDLGDADPGIKQAFKQMGERSQKALTAIQNEALIAQKAAYDVHQQYEQHQQAAQQATQQAHENEVSQRAVTYLDGLASPKYGVGESRTMAQTMASEQVMRTAGHLIRGMQSYGQTMPIESVMNAAILAVDGALPTAPVKPATTPVPALNPTAPTGTAPPRTRNVGSTGMAGGMMADAEYLDGARAILSR